MTVKILDCTLRDGSYAIDFRFTAHQTREICAGLESAGIELIEVGHGIGIGASERITPAFETDVVYAQAADAGTSSAEWGMFAIPGVASVREVAALADFGMGFVRIGIDIGEIDKGLDFLRQAKRLDLDVYVNFMKSYVLAPRDLLHLARQCIDEGATGIYLVDSAGGMLPSEIDSFGHELGGLSKSARLGFHGHDNLGLANANCISLLEYGFTLFDSSLQGLGRSAGNAVTEQLAAVFARMGYVDSAVAIGLMKLADFWVRPLLPYAGNNGLDTMSGFSLFHSSYLDALVRASSQHDADPYAVMEEITKVIKSDAPEDLLDRIASEVAEKGSAFGGVSVLGFFPTGDQ